MESYAQRAMKVALAALARHQDNNEDVAADALKVLVYWNQVPVGAFSYRDAHGRPGRRARERAKGKGGKGERAGGRVREKAKEKGGKGRWAGG